MGRLFWKFFLFIWLAQMAGIVGVGTYFWYERHQTEPPAAEAPPLASHPRGEQRPPPPHLRPHRPRLPVVPMFSALIVSLVSAFALAWYFAKPIRHLRRAFDAAAGGDLAVRIGAGRPCWHPRAHRDRPRRRHRRHAADGGSAWRNTRPAQKR